jgi:DNA invertase Pin-like site-specific DNA recombinase
MTTLAYPYLRYSSGRQGQGDSERRQGEWFAEVCKREGWQIDRSFVLEDRGKSAFKGDHLKADLGRFLEAVNAGRIPRGSVLLVEELDRLDRRSRKTAMPFIIGLLTAGISIRTRDRLYTEDSLDDLGDFIDITIKQGTANEESRKKSVRVGANWANWRARVAVGERVPPPGRLPPWVAWQRDHFVLVPGASAAVRLVYKLAGEGWGLRRILARLNGGKGEGGQEVPPVPVIGRCPTWRMSYLAKLLTWRAVLGEVEDVSGAVHAGLYPAVVTETDFYRAREALSGRTIGNKGVGRAGKGVPNLLSGLLRDAADGSRLHLINKGARYGGRCLVSSAALRRERGASRVTFPYQVFEAALLSRLREVKVSEVLGQSEEPDEVMVLAGQLRECEDAVKALTADLDEHGESPALFARLRKREAQRVQLAAQLAQARARAAHPLSESWGEAQSMLKAVQTAPNQLEARTRLKAGLRRVVEAVYCVFTGGRGQTHLAYVQVLFAGGRSREYLVCHVPANGNGNYKQPAAWSVASWADRWGTGHPKFTLRDNPTRARQIVNALTPTPGDEPLPPEVWFTSFEREHPNGEVEQVEIGPGRPELMEVMRQAATPEGGSPDPEVAGQLISQVIGCNTGLLRGRTPAVE